MRVITVHRRYRQTDRRTDRQTTYHGNTALCYASRGKKYPVDSDQSCIANLHCKIIQQFYYAGVRRRSVLSEYFYTVSQKLCQYYFLNNSVKHWPILIIFGKQHDQEET